MNNYTNLIILIGAILGDFFLLPNHKSFSMPLQCTWREQQCPTLFHLCSTSWPLPFCSSPKCEEQKLWKYHQLHNTRCDKWELIKSSALLFNNARGSQQLPCQPTRHNPSKHLQISPVHPKREIWLESLHRERKNVPDQLLKYWLV